ncbi:MAG: glycoside hydrolase family 3 N-terminal domain-containing protein [Patescibacteria group bacterium]
MIHTLKNLKWIILILIIVFFVISFLAWKSLTDRSILQVLEVYKNEGVILKDYSNSSNDINTLKIDLEGLKNEMKSKIESNKIRIFDNYKVLSKYVDLKSPNFNDNQKLNETIQNQEKLLKTYSTYFSDLKTENSNKKSFVNPLWETDSKKIDEILSNMTIDQLVSQLMIVGVNSTTLDEQELNTLKEIQPSGIILMGRNISSEDQLKSLNNSLQSTNTTIPMIINTDQEGGVVKRISWDNTTSQKEWSKMDYQQLCDEAKTRSKLLQRLGINANLSPVADLGYQGSYAFINDRTISSQPEIVAQKINDYLECFEPKTSSTLKHFPSHGMVVEDSHLVIPVNYSVTYQQWLESYAIPFKKNLNADFIMTGHFKVDKIDSKPASMSKKWITDTLLNEMDYKGLVITDDMEQFYNISSENKTQSAINALEAGNHLLLYVPPINQILPIRNDLITYFKNKRPFLEAKVKKILEYKKTI